MKTSVNSMPLKPQFKGNKFTGKIRRAIAGRFVKVGYVDGPAVVIYCRESTYPEEVGFNEHGEHRWIDSPKQIIAVGGFIKFPKL